MSKDLILQGYRAAPSEPEKAAERPEAEFRQRLTWTGWVGVACWMIAPVLAIWAWREWQGAATAMYYFREPWGVTCCAFLASSLAPICLLIGREYYRP